MKRATAIVSTAGLALAVALSAGLVGARAYADDVARLAPAWVLDDAPDALPWGVADVDASLALLDRQASDGDVLVSLDAATGAERARFRGWLGGFDGRPYYDLRPRLVAPGRVLVWRGVDTVALVDAGDGRELWRAPIEVGYGLGPLDRAVAGVIIVAHPTKGIVALDLADGRVRWRDAARPAVDAPLVAGGGRVAALGLDATLRLLDAADGRELWRAAWPDDPYSYWEARVVGARVVLASRTLVVLDAADGRELLRDPTPPPRYSGVSAASPTLFMRASFGAGVEALDPVRGTPMWKAKGALGDLEAVGGALFGCGAGEVVRALDLANGADLWSWGLPRCREPWPSERRNWRAAAGPDGTHLVARGPHGVVGFAADAAAEGGLAPERATLVGVARIDGIRRAGVRVRVADKTALTDALGRYALTVRARGMVHVALDRDEVRRLTPRPCPGDAERAVELTGAGRYRADLDARGYGYECDRACHCD